MASANAVRRGALTSIRASLENRSDDDAYVPEEAACVGSEQDATGYQPPSRSTLESPAAIALAQPPSSNRTEGHRRQSKRHRQRQTARETHPPQRR